MYLPPIQPPSNAGKQKSDLSDEQAIKLLKEFDEKATGVPTSYDYFVARFSGISKSALVSFISSGIFIGNGLFMAPQNSIHQIYQVLNVGCGWILFSLGGIAQHTKRNREN
jgi:hypothetical protein